MLTKILMVCVLPLIVGVLQAKAQDPLESVVMQQSAQINELKAQVEAMKTKLDTELGALQKLVGES